MIFKFDVNISFDVKVEAETIEEAREKIDAMSIEEVVVNSNDPLWGEVVEIIPEK